MHIPPLFVTVGCTYAGGGAPSRHPTLHFSGWARCQEHIWLTGRFVCGVSFLSFRFHNLHARTHTHTRTHTYARTFCELTCCCAARVCVRKAANASHRCTPTQTNTPAALGKWLWQSAEGEEANKTNSLIYMTVAFYISMPWQWSSEALLETGNEKWGSYLWYSVRTGIGSLSSQN